MVLAALMLALARDGVSLPRLNLPQINSTLLLLSAKFLLSQQQLENRAVSVGS